MPDAVTALPGTWRAMAKQAFTDGPIPNDEREHAGRWTMAEICADELEAALAQTGWQPMVKSLNGWRELGEEMRRVIEAMSDEQRSDLLPDWFVPRLDAFLMPLPPPPEERTA